MHIWTLSLDGNKATQRQTVALAEALVVPGLRSETAVTSCFPQSPQFVGGSNTAVTWQECLAPSGVERVICKGDQKLMPPWPDIVVSARPEVSALALSIKEASGNTTKIVHIQHPNGTAGHYRFDLNRFDVIVPQPHEKIDGDNVVPTRLALHGLTPNILSHFRAAAENLFSPMRRPIMAVLVGGSDEHADITEKMFQNFGIDLRELAEHFDGSLFVLTSRRTGEIGRDILHSYTSGNPRIFLDDQRFSYEALLGQADHFLVTADSLSMMSEALATRKPVWFYDFRRELSGHPLYETIQTMERWGWMDRYTYSESLRPTKNRAQRPYVDELPEVAAKVGQKLGL
ncbi:MAG: ELM1/GtrOC1 family putative glycosyltransferase [Alphaproteobacteria bacterium]|nr:ELM1/GtrOC1 family putative glycosyltransferase [Alphaproteobacteria bacterium]